MKILLLEDELMLQNSICEYLEKLKHIIVCYSDGEEAKNSVLNTNYDLLILDINVPTLNGLDFCKYLVSKNINTPIIFISAMDDIKSISIAFELGAVDYIKKPFHLKELAIRIEKVSNISDKNNIEHLVLSNNYTYDKSKKALYFNKEVQNLTKKQIEIIDFLCKNINSITSYDLLRSYVWDNSNVSDGTIRTEISRLRKILIEDFIINQKGLGYKINKYNINL